MIRGLVWAIGLLSAVTVAGTVGYMLLEHWGVLDAPDATVDANPTAGTLLRPGQRLVVLGSADQVAVLTEQACKL